MRLEKFFHIVFGNDLRRVSKLLPIILSQQQRLI